MDEKRRFLQKKKVALLILVWTIGFSMLLFGCGNLDALTPQNRVYPVDELRTEIQGKTDDILQDLFSKDWTDRPDRFYYSQLTEPEKRVYLLIEKYCEMRDPDLPFVPVSEDEYYNAVSAVWGDNPELFWVIENSLHTELSEDGETLINGVFIHYPAYIREDMEEVETVTDEIIAEIPEDATDYDKLKYFFDWIDERTSYVKTERDQDFRSVFIDGESRCGGYSDAFQYLCQKAGIPCISVTGWTYLEEVDENYHKWNMVSLDGEPYWVDVTSGDTFTDEYGISWPYNYGYLCMTDESANEIYKIDKKYGSLSAMEFQYPEATDSSLNYYKNNGGYFYGDDFYQVTEYIRSKFEEDITKDIPLEFYSKETFERAVDWLMNTDEVFDLVWEYFPWADEAYINSIQDTGLNYLCFSVELY